MSVIGVHLEKTQGRHSRRTDNTMIEPSDQESNTNMSANTDVTLHVSGSGSVPLGAGSVLHGGRSENGEDVVRSVQRGEEDPNRGTKSEVMVTLGRVLTVVPAGKQEARCRVAGRTMRTLAIIRRCSIARSW